MSNYTTELRFICETLSGLDESKGYNSVNSIISGSRTQIFDFEYPIFDSAYKSVLETKILKHYYTREICAETYGRWKLFLDARMNEIMPKYNKLYESELLSFNPLYDADYTRSGDRNTDTTIDDDSTVTDNTNSRNVLSGKDTRTVENELGGKDITESENELGGSDTTNRANEPVSDVWNYYSDTPQGGVNGLEDNLYLTNATHTTTTGEGSSDETTTEYGRTSDTTDTTTYGRTSDTTDETAYGRISNTANTGTTSTERDSSSNTVEDYAEHVIGKFPGKSYSKLLQEFRETFLNIDLMVINELSDLFFGLWE